MTIRHRRPLAVAGAALGCLLLTVCAGQTPTATNWIKGGADDQTIARELADCNAQANAALANEQGINADINATLGRNWQLGGTQTIEAQAMRRQASGYADQVLDNCMRAKGFSNIHRGAGAPVQ
jgi:alkylation response protein AidB-like acyl-CoA dehydrogenase